MFLKIHSLKETIPDFKQLVHQSFPVPIFCATKQLHYLNRGSSLHAITVAHVCVFLCHLADQLTATVAIKVYCEALSHAACYPPPPPPPPSPPPLLDARTLIRTEWWMMVVNRRGRALGINPHVYTPEPEWSRLSLFALPNGACCCACTRTFRFRGDERRRDVTPCLHKMASLCKRGAVNRNAHLTWGPIFRLRCA